MIPNYPDPNDSAIGGLLEMYIDDYSYIYSVQYIENFTYHDNAVINVIGT